MKTDGEIRDDVTGELERDPQITNSDAIGVAVKDGAVTLTATSRPTRPSCTRPCRRTRLRGQGGGQRAGSHAGRRAARRLRDRARPVDHSPPSLACILVPARSEAIFPEPGVITGPFGRSQYFPNGRR
jgi:hypothetical protein